jgi:hypothetical protein
MVPTFGKLKALMESVVADEKFWVNTATHAIELVHDHDEYGNVRDAITDGYVQGDYSHESNEFSLTASTPRTLCLAVRALLTNHSSIRGLTYTLLSGEHGHMDYEQMMQFRQSAEIPLTEGFDHPHLKGEEEWFRWMFGTAFFNADQARRMIASGEVQAQLHTVAVKDCYALLGLDKEEYGSNEFTDDWTSGRGINPMSAIQQRSTMKGMPDDKFNEPAIIVMVDSTDLMKRSGIKTKKTPEDLNGKRSPFLIDGNHRLGRLFLEGAEQAQVYVVPHEEALKFCYDRNMRPMLK